MASGITTANPPDLAIKALWIAPLEVGRIISVLIFSSYVHRAWRTNSGLLCHPVKMTPYKLETKPDRRLARLFSYRCRLQSGNALLTPLR